MSLRVTLELTQGVYHSNVRSTKDRFRGRQRYHLQLLGRRTSLKEETQERANRMNRHTRRENVRVTDAGRADRAYCRSPDRSISRRREYPRGRMRVWRDYRRPQPHSSCRRTTPRRSRSHSRTSANPPEEIVQEMKRIVEKYGRGSKK